MSSNLKAVSTAVNSTQSTVSALSKDIEHISSVVTNTQTTLISLRDAGFHIQHFLRTFPAELRSYLRSILQSNMRMYSILLQIQDSVAARPTLRLDSNIKFEDALGVVRDLPYEWFRHWEVPICFV
jgi:hypothetical protein